MADEIKRRAPKGGGSIFQDKTGTWICKLPASPLTNNKEKRFKAKTRALLVKKVNAFKESVANGTFVEDDKSLDASMLYWLDNVKRQELKPSSFDRLESTVMTHIVPAIGNYAIRDVTPEIIETNVFAELRKQNPSHSTVKKVYDALNSFFKYYDIRNHTRINPMPTIAKPKKENYEASVTRWFTEEETKAFKQSCMSKYSNGEYRYYYGYVFILMLNTGVRGGEMLQMKWDDIDEDNHLAFIRGNRITVINRDADEEKPKYKTIDQETAKTKAGTLRQIPLNDNAFEALKMIKEIYRSRGNGMLSGYVVSSKEGNPINLDTLIKSYKKVLVNAGIEDENCGLHALRHTFATSLIENNVDIKTVSEILGHSNISITYNTYIHVIQKQKIKAVSLINL